MDAAEGDAAHDPIERWAPIPGFKAHEASTHGKIRSSTTTLATSVNPRTGRESVTLWDHAAGGCETVTVHRLVMLAHGGEPPNEGDEVCHRNGDKTDNRYANLRWGSRSDNQREKVRHGSRGGPQRINEETACSIRLAQASGRTQQAVADEFGVSRSLVSMIWSGDAWAMPDIAWPLPNVHLGVSAEDQKWANIRVPALLETPAAVRWVSAEPLLGPIDFGPWMSPVDWPECWDTHSTSTECARCIKPGWIVVGGESGPAARPMALEWAQRIVDDCKAAGVPVFVKQLPTGPRGKVTQDIATFPESLRVREYPAVAS